MTTKAATEESLGLLHEKVAKVMTNVLDVYEVSQEVYLAAAEQVGDNPELLAALPAAPEVSAPMLSAITKFLNDNKISCEASTEGAASELAKTLEERRKNRRKVGNVVHLDDAV